MYEHERRYIFRKTQAGFLQPAPFPEKPTGYLYPGDELVLGTKCELHQFNRKWKAASVDGGILLYLRVFQTYARRFLWWREG